MASLNQTAGNRLTQSGNVRIRYVNQVDEEEIPGVKPFRINSIRFPDPVRQTQT
ncbi:hypothetical protein SAMN04488090_4454 [Siphonobacter aquaeclarae]|jgi:hypothetical protein|uniref:Uncharacterized protein n=1 Tax=Siphonobacter aquaeclarae TaxID=563176 RepID=A0A1G9WVJ5_9BACT|nr:hypothetical protein SAMN04488090_4454 [Siphonobacter aquaeclarae]